MSDESCAAQSGKLIQSAVRIGVDVSLDDPSALGFVLSRLDSKSQAELLVGFVDGVQQLGEVGLGFQLQCIAESLPTEDDIRAIPGALRELADRVDAEITARIYRAIGEYTDGQ